MQRSREISWRPDCGRRLYGRFAGYTDDGKVRIYQGLSLHLVDPALVTWEMD